MANVSITVPDAALPKVRLVFGGGTNAETVAAVKAYLEPLLRNYVRETLRTRRRTLEAVAMDTGEVAEASQFDAVWP